MVGLGIALERACDDGDVLAAETLTHEVIPFPGERGENGKVLGIGFFESQVDVF